MKDWLIMVLSLFIITGTSACSSVGKDQSTKKTTPKTHKTTKAKPETTDDGSTGSATEKQENEPTPNLVAPAPTPVPTEGIPATR